MRRTLLVLALASVLSIPAAQAAPVDRTITMTSIGGLRLGLTASQYLPKLGKKTFVTRYGDGTSRLLSVQRNIAVFLGTDGRGHMISTSDADYRLQGGSGPCGSFAVLRRSHTVVARSVHGPLGTTAAVYRVGRLWFTIGAPGQIGSVTLADRAPAPTMLLGLSRCGTGEEGG